MGGVGWRFDEDHHGEREKAAGKLDYTKGHHSLARANDVLLQPWWEGRHERCAHWEVGAVCMLALAPPDSIDSRGRGWKGRTRDAH